MKRVLSFWLMVFVTLVPIYAPAQKGAFAEIKQLQGPQNPRLGFIIHGGAGVIKRGSLTPEREKEIRAKLEEVVLAGYKALQAGKSGVDAVELAIRMMEDSPLFNAGKGAVFTHDGKNELDASIMDGKTLAAGAVAGLHHVKNPITLARDGNGKIAARYDDRRRGREVCERTECRAGGREIFLDAGALGLAAEDPHQEKGRKEKRPNSPR